MKNVHLVAGLAGIVATIAGCALLIAQSPRAEAQPATAIAIDMDPTSTPANNANTVGTIQDCARIDVDGVQNADEDVVDGLIIDVTAQGIAPYSNNGTPADPSDDTGGITGYHYGLGYPSALLTVAAVENATPAVNMLANTAGSSVFPASEPVPDDNADDNWSSDNLDTSASVPEDGDGVLDRVTITAEVGAATGQYAIVLRDATHLDAAGTAHIPLASLDANIAINMACGAFLTPSPSPTASPTASPSPSPSPSPTPSPTPTTAPAGTGTPTRTPSPAPGAATPTRTPTPRPANIQDFNTGGSPQTGGGMSPFVIAGTVIMFAGVGLGGYTLTRRLRRGL